MFFRERPAEWSKKQVTWNPHHISTLHMTCCWWAWMGDTDLFFHLLGDQTLHPWMRVFVALHLHPC